jgi:hypothetical protein
VAEEALRAADPSLTATRRALAAYDARIDQLDAEIIASNHRTLPALLAEQERLEAAVGIAFGQDTAGLNSPDTCAKLIRPGPARPPVGAELSFVRRCVASVIQKEREAAQGQDPPARAGTTGTP